MSKNVSCIVCKKYIHNNMMIHNFNICEECLCGACKKAIVERCKICHKVSEGCVEHTDYVRIPYTAQYLCQKCNKKKYR